MALQPQALAMVAQRTIGCLSTASGINGSGAVSSRQTNSPATATAVANSDSTGADVHS